MRKKITPLVFLFFSLSAFAQNQNRQSDTTKNREDWQCPSIYEGQDIALPDSTKITWTSYKNILAQGVPAKALCDTIEYLKQHAGEQSLVDARIRRFDNINICGKEANIEKYNQCVSSGMQPDDCMEKIKTDINNELKSDVCYAKEKDKQENHGSLQETYIGKRNVTVKSDVAAIIDYGINSLKNRLFLVNLQNGTVTKHKVAHGEGSGDAILTSYSNIYFSNPKEETHKTALGIYLGGERYHGSKDEEGIQIIQRRKNTKKAKRQAHEIKFGKKCSDPSSNLSKDFFTKCGEFDLTFENKFIEEYENTGLSLNLYGMEESNDNAALRKIVMHGASYVDLEYPISKLTDEKRAGRSWGCPAVSWDDIVKMVKKLSQGRVIYAYQEQIREQLKENPKLQDYSLTDKPSKSISLPGEESDYQAKR
jgi:hypothetical protein